jgi:predicted transcriptional regulator of viral defense system
MKWEEVVKRRSSYPLFEPEEFYIGEKHPAAVQVQISRWVKEGKLVKLATRRYLVNDPYRKVDPCPERIANWLVYPSYVSLEYALSFYGLIPEGVPVVTSVTTRRPRRYETAAGRFSYRHIKRELFWGYRMLASDRGSYCLAVPEKALLDFFYLSRGDWSEARHLEMRWQNAEEVDRQALKRMAERMNQPRLVHLVSGFLRAAA